MNATHLILLLRLSLVAAVFAAVGACTDAEGEHGGDLDEEGTFRVHPSNLDCASYSKNVFGIVPGQAGMGTGNYMVCPAARSRVLDCGVTIEDSAAPDVRLISVEPFYGVDTGCNVYVHDYGADPYDLYLHALCCDLG